MIIHVRRRRPSSTTNCDRERKAQAVFVAVVGCWSWEGWIDGIIG